MMITGDRIGGCRFVSLAASVFASVMLASVSVAQQTDPPVAQPRQGPAHSFLGYQTPAECAGGALTDERMYWRDRFVDTVSVAIPNRLLQPSTIASIKQCLSKFSVERLAPRELFGFARAHLLSQGYDEADRAFALVAAAAAKELPEPRAWTLYNIVDVYLSAAPPRVQSAQVYLSKLDSLGVSASPERARGYAELAKVARFWDSTNLQMKAATAAVKAAREIPLERLREYSAMGAPNPAWAYYELAWAKARQNDPDGGVEMLELGANTLGPLTKRGEAAGLTTLELPRFLALGKPAPAVPADWRFVPPDHPEVEPKPGKPSIVVLARSGHFEQYAVLQRLLAKFTPLGVGATYSTETRGYVGNKIALPDSEAIYIRDYYFQKRKIPMVISIARTDFEVRSDGVHEQKGDRQSPYEVINQMNGRQPVFLIDKKGILRIVADLTVENEPMLSNMLTEMLAEP